MRSEVWAGVRAGDPVAVAGTRRRGATWAFRAHVRNARSGAEWVEVVGGRQGDRALRSFRPDQVYPVVGRRRRAGSGGPASLAEAPQLPLGPPAGPR